MVTFANSWQTMHVITRDFVSVIEIQLILGQCFLIGRGAN